MGMVADGILTGVFYGDLRMTGSETSPDLTADEAAAAVFVVIVVPAGDGGQQTVTQVVLTRAVFGPIGGYVGNPVFTQLRGGQILAVADAYASVCAA